jgi:hypothetical protein
VSAKSQPSRPPADTSAIAIIESWLPKVLSSTGKSMEGTSPCLRLSLSGVDGGEWDLQIADGEFVNKALTRRSISRRDDPDIWIRMPAVDFLAVMYPSEDLFEFLPPTIDIVDLLCPESEEMELVEKLNGRIKFELEGRRRRRWSVDAAFGRLGILAGRPRTTVSIDASTCEKLAARTLNPLQALLSGRLRVDGDKTFAMQVLMLVATRVGG